jgi:hypothetical protein
MPLAGGVPRLAVLGFVLTAHIATLRFDLFLRSLDHLGLVQFVLHDWVWFTLFCTNGFGSLCSARMGLVRFASCGFLSDLCPNALSPASSPAVQALAVLVLFLFYNGVLAIASRKMRQQKNAR